MKKKKQRTLSGKIMLGLSFFAVLNLVFISAFVGIDYTVTENAEYEDNAFSMARAAAAFIDGDRVLDYLNVVGTDASGNEIYYRDDYYDVVSAYLNSVQSNYSFVKYYYVIYPGEDSVTYIWDSSASDLYSSQREKDYYVEEPYDVIMRAFNRDPIEKMFVSRSKVWGFLASAYYPVYNSAGDPVAVVGVDLAVDGVAQLFIHYFRMVFLAVLFLTAVFFVVGYKGTKKNLLVPIEQLNTAAKDLVQDLDAGRHFDLEIHTGDELEELAGSFRKMDNDLHDYIDRLSSVTTDRERIHAEFDIAKQIQTDILPNEYPAFPERNDFDIYAALNPCQEIGGDFYDFFLIDKDHLVMVMGDVSDRGVPAALYMVMVQTLIKNRAVQGFSPAEVLQSISEQMLQNHMEMFSTIWLAILELSTGKGIAANAGHQHPVLCRAGKRFELQKYHHSPPVGAIEGIRFRDHGFQLQPGDTVFVFSDGVREAANEREELFDTERILNALNYEPEATPSVLLQTVKAAIERFVGDEKQVDDLTMLSMKYYGPDAGRQ